MAQMKRSCLRMSKITWKTKQDESKERDILNAKSQLEKSDYMIIKCYEYQLVGKELPYNLEALHRDRQAMRDKINQLER